MSEEVPGHTFRAAGRIPISRARASPEPVEAAAEAEEPGTMP